MPRCVSVCVRLCVCVCVCVCVSLSLSLSVCMCVCVAIRLIRVLDFYKPPRRGTVKRPRNDNLCLPCSGAKQCPRIHCVPYSQRSPAGGVGWRTSHSRHSSCGGSSLWLAALDWGRHELGTLRSPSAPLSYHLAQDHYIVPMARPRKTKSALAALVSAFSGTKAVHVLPKPPRLLRKNPIPPPPPPEFRRQTH